MTAEAAKFAVINMDALNKQLSKRQKLLRKTNLQPMRLRTILAHIESMEVDPELKASLIKQASRYPTQALERFAANFDQIVIATQKELRKMYIIDQIKAQNEEAAPVAVEPVPIRKVEPKPLIRPKKIDLKEMFDRASDLLETPIEYLEPIPEPIPEPVKVAEKPKPEKKVQPEPAQDARSMFAQRLANMEFE